MKRRPHPPRRRRRAGMTLVETAIALALFAVVVIKAALVLGSANETHGVDSATMNLEDQARRVLDQIAYAVMGSDRESLLPGAESPFHQERLSFAVSLGVEDGEVVWSDPEEIGLSDDESQVVYRRNPDTPEELRVAWCNVVRPFLEGELPNAIDDNGNGITDEKGLSFVLDGDAVTIRLSVEKGVGQGATVTQTVSTTVTVRN